MKGKGRLILIGSVCLVLALVALPFMGACAPAPEAEEPGWPTSLIVGAGPTGGGLCMLASGVGPYWEEALGIPVTISPGGLPPNMDLFRQKELDINFSASGFLLSAYKGTGEYPSTLEGPATELRCMFHVYANPWFFIAKKGSGMTKVSDLKGKRIGFSGGPAAWDVQAAPCMAEEGIDYFEDVERTFGTVDEIGTMVADGLIDACEGMLEGLVPQPGILKLMQDRECVLLWWTKEATMKREGETVCPPWTIKKELMPDYLDKDFPTYLGGHVVLLAREDMDPDFVYQLCKIWYENLDKLAEENPYWKYPAVYPDFITTQYGVPYHPGAIKYWEEVGLWQGD